MIAGLSLRHTRGHLFRPAYEGIAFGVRHILDLLEEAGGPASSITAVGGGTQGGLWMQIVSDVTGREQVLPKQIIGACYGLGAAGRHRGGSGARRDRLDVLRRPGRA